MHRIRGWWAVAVVLLICGGVMALRQSQVASLRRVLATKTTEAAQAEALRHENEAARAKPPAAVVDRSDDIARARAERDAAKRRVDALVASRAAAAVRPVPVRFGAGAVVRASEWSNAGLASPQAALETALWAAAGGDVTQLAATLAFFDEKTKAKAQALLDGLPPAERGRYQTPEGLVAALTIPQVPSGGEASVASWSEVDRPDGKEKLQSVGLRVSGSDGASKRTVLLLRSAGDGWRLLVSSGAVDKLAAQLKPTERN